MTMEEENEKLRKENRILKIKSMKFEDYSDFIYYNYNAVGFMTESNK